MHLPDGIVSPTVAIAGYGLAGGMTWFCLKKIDRAGNVTEQIPKAALLTAGFFTISSIHVPLPFGSIHLLLNGLIGIVLGYLAFPAISIGLFFQAVLFQHGGLSTLGLNAVLMGLPALLAYGLYQLGQRWQRPWQQGTLAFVAGGGALLTSAAIFSTLAIAHIPADLDAGLEQAGIIAGLALYSVQALIEGAFTVMAVTYFARVKPELLEKRL
ncbi:MAG: cobalt transporter CbiM [Cyanobacteria bacterium J06641_5]